MDDRLITLGIANTHDSAYEKGYRDYNSHLEHNAKSLLNPAYNPPEGSEESYKAGWEAARNQHLNRGAIIPEGILDE